MTPIQKPSPVHVIELVECSHPVRTYLEQIDKYVSYLEWLVKERDAVIAELREDLYGDGVTDDGRDADLLLSDCSDTASYGRLIPDVALAEDKHENPPIIDVSGLFPSKTDEKGVEIAPVPVFDFVKMTETEQEELTVVAVPAKRRGCPPGGWPKKDPSEVIAKAPKVKKTVGVTPRPNSVLVISPPTMTTATGWRISLPGWSAASTRGMSPIPAASAVMSTGTSRSLVPRMTICLVKFSPSCCMRCR